MIQSTEDFLILPIKSLEIKGIAGHCRCRGLPVSRFFVLRGLNAGERNLEFEPSLDPAGGKLKGYRKIEMWPLDSVVNKGGAKWQYNEFGQQRRRKRHFWRSA